MADAVVALFAHLTRAARESEEGEKEGKRKRSHSFQVTEADAASELFRGELCQSRQTAIVQVSPKDGGGGGHALMMRGRGALGEEWERNLNFCKVTSHRLRFQQRGTLMAATGSEH